MRSDHQTSSKTARVRVYRMPRRLVKKRTTDDDFLDDDVTKSEVDDDFGRVAVGIIVDFVEFLRVNEDADTDMVVVALRPFVFFLFFVDLVAAATTARDDDAGMAFGFVLLDTVDDRDVAAVVVVDI